MNPARALGLLALSAIFSLSVSIQAHAEADTTAPAAGTAEPAMGTAGTNDGNVTPSNDSEHQMSKKHRVATAKRHGKKKRKKKKASSGM